MKDVLTKTNLESAGNGLSDWARVDALDEKDIESAIRNDADTFAASDRDVWVFAPARLPRLAVALHRGRLRRWARPLRRSEQRALALG